MPRRRSALNSESGRKPCNGWSGRGLTVAHRPRALLLALLAAPIPIPIGRGPEFRPPRVGAVQPVAVSCVAGPPPGAARVHLELFARRRAIVIPAGIGVRRDCRYPLRTLTPTGVIEVGRRGLTLGDFFSVWRMPLSGRRMLTFHGAVRAYVGGRRWTGDPRAIGLTNRRQIVLEVGPYVPPHAFFLFPPR
jgi:hypothetical protein